MASKIVLQSGSWQDAHANPVANGTLVLTLSQDAVVTANNNQIAPIIVQFPLDANGSLIASPTPDIWGNDQLSPTNTFYTAEVLNAGGSRVWGPEKWTLTGPGPINTGGIPPSPSGGGTQPPTQYPSRITAFYLVIDGGGSTPGTGVKGQFDVPTNCTLTGWVLTADQSGSAVIDVLRSTYSGFPTTASIAGTDKPTLTSAQKNENLGPLSNWTSTALSTGDQLQFNLNSVATVQRLNLTLVTTIP